MITFDYNIKYRQGQIKGDEHLIRMIRTHFSVKNNEKVFAKNKQFVPDRFYAITKTGLFDLGLYQEIRDYLITKQIVDVETTDEFLKNLDVGFLCEVKDDLGLRHRDYGLVATENALKAGRGVILSATGSGKSFLTASLIHNIIASRQDTFSRALVVVPGIGLVNQLTNDFKGYSVPFSVCSWSGGKTIDENAQVIICNSEILISKFSNYPFLRDVDLVIVDECHQIKRSNKITECISKIRTPNKYGFTGTLPEAKIDYWKIIGLFGPIVFQKDSYDLRESDYLADVQIRILKVNHGDVSNMDYRSELEYIQTSEKRNNLIKNLVFKFDKNCLIMVDFLEYGETLLDLLKADGKETYFVRGDMPVIDRQAIIDKMERQDNIICIAMSSIFSTGVNVKNLHYIVFTSAKKSFVRIVQSIGRGLRLHPTKKHLTIFDICDNLTYSSSHSENRKRIYDEQRIEWKEVEFKL